MKANTDVKAGIIIGFLVDIDKNIATNHNFTAQGGLLNINQTTQVAGAGV